MTEPARSLETVHRVRVRYCETDRMGIAHHGSYIAWFEEARTEMLRAHGMSYRQMEDDGFLLQIVDVGVTYRRSVTYDDIVAVHASVTARKRASMTISYVVRLDDSGELIAEGHTTLACVDREGRVQRLPAGL